MTCDQCSYKKSIGSKCFLHCDEECPICLEIVVFTLMSQNTQLQCGHWFHSKCIKQWFLINKTCPTCNQKGTVHDKMIFCDLCRQYLNL